MSLLCNMIREGISVERSAEMSLCDGPRRYQVLSESRGLVMTRHRIENIAAAHAVPASGALIACGFAWDREDLFAAGRKALIGSNQTGTLQVMATAPAANRVAASTPRP